MPDEPYIVNHISLDLARSIVANHEELSGIEIPDDDSGFVDLSIPLCVPRWLFFKAWNDELYRKSQAVTGKERQSP